LRFWTLSIVLFYLKHNVSETGFCLHLQVDPSQLGSIDKDSPYLQIPAPSQDQVKKVKAIPVTGREDP
jgi:hypothetical protein